MAKQSVNKTIIEYHREETFILADNEIKLAHKALGLMMAGETIDEAGLTDQDWADTIRLHHRLKRHLEYVGEL